MEKLYNHTPETFWEEKKHYKRNINKLASAEFLQIHRGISFRSLLFIGQRFFKLGLHDAWSVNFLTLQSPVISEGFHNLRTCRAVTITNSTTINLRSGADSIVTAYRLQRETVF